MACPAPYIVSRKPDPGSGCAVNVSAVKQAALWFDFFNGGKRQLTFE
jgi:hypothetical protein